MVAAEKQETKPPLDQHQAGHDGKTDTTALHHQVQDIHAGGNVKPPEGKVAEDRAGAAKVYGHVEITDHKGQAASATSTPGGDHAATTPAGGEAHKPEAKPAEGGVWNWVKNTASSAEQMGENAIHKTSDMYHNGVDSAKNLTGKIEDTASKDYASAKKTIGEDYDSAKHSIGHKVDQAMVIGHNLKDVGETMGQGLKESAVNTVEGAWKGIKTAEKATVNGVEHAAHWAHEHPVEALAVGAAVVGAVALEIGTGGLATGAIAEGAAATVGFLSTPAAVTAFEVAGVTAAGLGTVNAGIDVAKHGELGTMMNQQNEKPETVAKAREQLKKDTGDALLGDTMLGAGYGIKWGAQGISALRTAAAEGSAAKQAIAVEEHTPSKIAEEVADTGAAIAGLMDKVRQIAGGVGTAYENLSGAKSTYGTVQGAVGTAGRIGSSYSVATPQKPGTDNNNNNTSNVPDEPTRH